MNKKQIGKTALLKRNKLTGFNRKGALGMREARREKRQSRAVLAAIWGLLEQLGIGQKLLQKDITSELEPKAKSSLHKSVLELCSAFKRVGISASRWALSQQLPKWDWNEVKRMIRHLDWENSKSAALRRALGEQIKEHLVNAPRSYADAIYQAQNTKEIHLIVKGAEKAQRAQLTRLQTELKREKIDRSWIQNGRRPTKSGTSKLFDEKSRDQPLQSLKKRLETEIERARFALGNLTLKVASLLVKINGKEMAKSIATIKARQEQSPLMIKARRGRPPAHETLAMPSSSALDQAHHKWEMAYSEIKKLLRASRKKNR